MVHRRGRKAGAALFMKWATEEIGKEADPEGERIKEIVRNRWDKLETVLLAMAINRKDAETSLSDDKYEEEHGLCSIVIPDLVLGFGFDVRES